MGARKLANQMALGGYSMQPAAWLLELYEAGKRAAGVDGAIVEAGVYNGGSAVMLAAGAGGNRDVWLFDSWAGLPEPRAQDGERAIRRWNALNGEMNVGSVAMTKEAFSIAGLPEPRCVPGWFEDTLLHADIRRIAVLHIDADWYESCKLCLQILAPRVAPGGVIIVHDYFAWPGAQTAVNEHLGLKRIAGVGLTWRA